MVLPSTRGWKVVAIAEVAYTKVDRGREVIRRWLPTRRFHVREVTNQVTTTSGNDRRSATQPDAVTPPTCDNPTQPDAIRRNWHAWHAEGQGFESS
jgi:hypothetical protein